MTPAEFLSVDYQRQGNIDMQHRLHRVAKAIVPVG